MANNLDSWRITDHMNNVCREDWVTKEVLEKVVATEIRWSYFLFWTLTLGKRIDLLLGRLAVWKHNLPVFTKVQD